MPSSNGATRKKSRNPMNKRQYQSLVEVATAARAPVKGGIPLECPPPDKGSTACCYLFVSVNSMPARRMRKRRTGRRTRTAQLGGALAATSVRWRHRAKNMGYTQRVTFTPRVKIY